MTVGGIEPLGKKEIRVKRRKRLMSNQFDGFFFYSKPNFDTETHSNCTRLCVRMSPSPPVQHKMIGAIRFIRQSVSPATVTHPSPPTLVILRRKSTEFRLGGFHLRMSSHLPALYLCRDSQQPAPTPKQQ